MYIRKCKKNTIGNNSVSLTHQHHELKVNTTTPQKVQESKVSGLPFGLTPITRMVNLIKDCTRNFLVLRENQLSLEPVIFFFPGQVVSSRKAMKNCEEVQRSSPHAFRLWPCRFGRDRRFSPFNLHSNLGILGNLHTSPIPSVYLLYQQYISRRHINITKRHRFVYMRRSSM